MKPVVFAFLAASGLAAQTAQTTACTATNAPVVLVSLAGIGNVCAPLDVTTLKLQAVNGVWTLSAVSTAQVPLFVDGEVPAGDPDGTRTQWTLASAPYPATSLLLHRNGVLQKPGTDYTLAGNAIKFAVPPQVGDTLLAYYRVQS